MPLSFLTEVLLLLSRTLLTEKLLDPKQESERICCFLVSIVNLLVISNSLLTPDKDTTT